MFSSQSLSLTKSTKENTLNANAAEYKASVPTQTRSQINQNLASANFSQPIEMTNYNPASTVLVHAVSTGSQPYVAYTTPFFHEIAGAQHHHNMYHETYTAGSQPFAPGALNQNLPYPNAYQAPPYALAAVSTGSQPY